MKRWKKTALIIGGVVVVIALVVGGIVWSKRGTVSVQVGTVGREDLASIVTASGEIKPPPEKLANVNANSFGKITELLVHEGDRVKKGQLLLRTEDVQQSANVDAQQAAIHTAQADISAQQATVESSAASLKTAQANLAQAEAKLTQSKADFARNQQAFKDQLISQQAYDQSLSDFQVAKANVQSVTAQVEQNKALYQQAVYNRDMAHARLNQNRAQLLGFKNQLAQTVYVSPLDGIITSLPVHLGENVVPGIQNATGSVLFQVSDLSVITAEVNVDETDIVNVKLGQPAEVTIDAIPNKTFKGKVTEIGQAAISRSTGQTTTASTAGNTTEEAKDFKVVVTLDTPPPGLRPGLSTTAKITTATRQNVVGIPIQALTIRTRRELEESEKKSNGKALAASKQAAPATPSAKELEREKEELQGVFVIRNGMAAFVQVDTGIMGTTDV
ncbi:MAG TPA: efflux RND transporter periplasmic adaptor subunit, partial [Terriglobia bacterium]|nr:efflux RND transporter periplasmic adaptor subunit [Terriglobia bacterium]